MEQRPNAPLLVVLERRNKNPTIIKVTDDLKGLWWAGNFSYLSSCHHVVPGGITRVTLDYKEPPGAWFMSLDVAACDKHDIVHGVIWSEDLKELAKKNGNKEADPKEPKYMHHLTSGGKDDRPIPPGCFLVDSAVWCPGGRPGRRPPPGHKPHHKKVPAKSK